VDGAAEDAGGDERATRRDARDQAGRSRPGVDGHHEQAGDEGDDDPQHEGLRRDFEEAVPRSARPAASTTAQATPHPGVDAPVTVADTVATVFMITSCATPEATTASATSSHAHVSPRVSSTTPTMPRSVRRPRRIARYWASAPAPAEHDDPQHASRRPRRR